MDSRIIKSSSHHKRVDLREKETQQALEADLRKIKARRRRSSSSNSNAALPDCEVRNSLRDGSNLDGRSSPSTCQKVIETTVCQTSIVEASSPLSAHAIEKRVSKQISKKPSMVSNEDVSS